MSLFPARYKLRLKNNLALSIVNAEKDVEEISIVNLPACDTSMMMIDYNSVAKVRRNLIALICSSFV